MAFLIIILRKSQLSVCSYNWNHSKLNKILIENVTSQQFIKSEAISIFDQFSFIYKNLSNQ